MLIGVVRDTHQVVDSLLGEDAESAAEVLGGQAEQHEVHDL